MDESGTLLPPGERGEIVVRGRNVTRGYEENADGDAGTFVNGWYCTGDSGTLDGDGFLSLTGRLKDIINRGGEKIPTGRFDEILLRHPDVREAGCSWSASDAWRKYRGRRDKARRANRQRDGGPSLRVCPPPGFQNPDRILVVDTIPKGPTGKVRRTQLADFSQMPSASPSSRRRTRSSNRVSPPSSESFNSIVSAQRQLLRPWW